jgi:hypothetical protein
MVGELSERELFEVLKGLYRSLQKAFHPDTARQKPKAGRDRAVELNLAFEALNLDKNRQSFRTHRRSYLQKHHPVLLQRNASLLSDRLRVHAAREERLAEGYLSFILAGAGGPPAVADAEETAWTVELPAARNVLLGLQDVAIKNNVRHASWLLGSNYKNIEINSEGEMRVRSVGRRNFAEARSTVLLGCVPKDTVNITPLLERCPPSKIYKCPPLTEFDPDALPQISVLNLISQDNFKKHLLSSLCPVLMERAYLFSVNRREFSVSGLISLEGVIVKMEAITAATASGTGAA